MADSTLEMRHPWTMPYLDTVDIFIDALHKQIGPKHPLYRREVLPLALRCEPDAVIYETDDEPLIYALVYLSWSKIAVARKRRGNLRTEILPDYRAIQARMDQDSEEWTRQFR